MIPYNEVLAPDVNNKRDNPDKPSINKKRTIQIPMSLSDISASGYLPRVQTSYGGNEIVIYDDDDASTIGDVYYTPLYTEKINYNEWKIRINKSFEELEAL